MKKRKSKPAPIQEPSRDATSSPAVTDSPALSPGPGEQLGGRYSLKRVLEWGTGPGVTWAAFDETAGKEIALHVLPAGILQDAAAMRALRGLVRTSRKVVHPNIVRIHELICGPDWAALRVDLVEGDTLAALQAKKEKGCFEAGEIKPWIFQLCEILRDAGRVRLPLEIAPASLIVTPQGRLMAVNFRAYRSQPGDTIYSLGALMHELLTGKEPPSEGLELEIPGEQIPAEWKGVMAACLDKDPAKRPAGVMEVARRLGQEEEAPAPAPPPPDADTNVLTILATQVPAEAKQVRSVVPEESAPSAGERREGFKFPALAIAAVVIGLAIVAAAVFYKGGTGTSEETSAPTPVAAAEKTPAETKAPSPTPPPPQPVIAKQPSPTPAVAATPVDKQAARQQAEAALQAALKNADEKARLAVAAKQSAEEAATVSEQKEQARQLAEATAAAAQRVAQEKTQIAQDAGKGASEAEGEAKSQAAVFQKAESDLLEAQKNVDETRKIAAVAEAAAGDTQGAARATASPSAAAVATPGASPEPSIMVLRAEPVLPMKNSKTPTLSIEAAPPETPIQKALINSLGMRFEPVGNVLFSIWVTRVKDFAAFVDATGFSSNAWKDPGFEQGPDHPVVYVSWEDAMSFCKWLTEKERKAGLLTPGQYYRLPTDLEWSKAVGLQDETGSTAEARDMDVPNVFPWGTQWPPPARAGNYTGEETNSDVAIKGYNDGYIYTSPVGAFPPNKLGLYDVGGNVSQWCMDSWNSEQRAKVLRGGSWYNGALRLSLLSSCRVHAPPETSTDNWGFRVVIASDAPNSQHK